MAYVHPGSSSPDNFRPILCTRLISSTRAFVPSITLFSFQHTWEPMLVKFKKKKKKKHPPPPKPKNKKLKKTFFLQQ